MRANVRDNVVYKQPTTLEARAAIANSCLTELGLSMPFLLDNMENTTAHAYAAWPNRIYVIDLEGKVAMKGPKGPRGADLAGAERALKRLLAQTPRKPEPKPDAKAEPDPDPKPKTETKPEPAEKK